MQHPQLRELFERYVEHGDTAALGEAFDLSAPDLLRVARHLAANRHDADDLVQSTYLTAIEKLHTLERGRDPLPWLVGILVLHARNQRRRRGRRVELPELASNERPDLAAERAEFAQSVRQALAELPERYAAVVGPYLAGERSSLHLGEATGRAPGTVRMQIHRGLALLRRALGGAGGFGAWGVGLELARLRGRVLEGAANSRGATLARPRSPLLARSLLVGAAALLSTIAVWLWGSASPANSLRSAHPSAPTGSALAVEPAASRASVVAAVSSKRSAVTRAEASSNGAEASRGVRGKLVLHDARPLAGVEVRLLALPYSFLTLDLGAPPQSAPQLERSRTNTDSEGRFVLPGGRRGEHLLLAIDCAGPRGALRLVDGSPAADGELDLGELRIDASVKLRGRVVDALGAAVPGARVRRLANLAQFDTGWTADGFANELAGRVAIAAIPPWIRAWFEVFPTPTTTCAVDGSFELEVDAGASAVLIDKRGYEPLRVAIKGSGGERELGELVLERARTVAGRVVDARNEPAANAEVLVGARTDPKAPVNLIRASLTDERGAFECVGVPREGRILVAARLSTSCAWTTREFAADEGIVLQLAQAALDVTVRDEAGAAVSDVELDLRPLAVAGMRPNGLLDREALTRRGSGVVRFESLAPGAYLVAARKRGFAPVSAEITLGEEPRELELVLSVAHMRSVLVVDVRSRAPVADASVVMSDLNRTWRSRATTDAAGRAELTPPSGADLTRGQLEVAHAQFATTLASLAAASDGPQVVELGPGASLRVQVLERGQPSKRRWTVQLGTGSAELMRLWASTRGAGVAELDSIPPGKWTWELREGWATRDAAALLNESFGDEPPIREGVITLGEGAVSELTVELEPAHTAPNDGRARLHGRFAIDGSSRERLALALDGLGSLARSHHDAQLDAEGAFDFGWIPAGRYRAELRFERASEPTAMYSEPWRASVELAAGEVRRLDVALARTRLNLRVTDASGAPVAGAHYEVLDTRGSRLGRTLMHTGDDGRDTFLVWSSGRYGVFAEHPVAGFVQREIEVAPDTERVDVELVLDPGVTCSGTAQAPEALLGRDSAGGRWLNLHLLRVDVPGQPSRRVSVRADSEGRGAWRVAGLQPGRYSASLGVSGPARSAPLEFELGPNGASGMELKFEVAGQAESR